MVRERRATESTVAHLDGLNVKTDLRRERRALAVHELRMLLNTTETGQDRYGMTGTARAMLYQLTVETGLRLKSRWVGDEVVCDWTPRPEFAAGPKHILYGGIISAVMDCHSIWTAIATAYRDSSR